MSAYIRALLERKRARQAEERRAEQQADQLRRQAEAERDQIIAEAQGEQGPPGPQGPKGDKPDHEWKGAELRFEKPDGSWGPFVNLQGPRGGRGGSGGGGSSFTPGSLPLAPLPVVDTDNLILERAGSAYRVSIETLKTVFGTIGDTSLDGGAASSVFLPTEIVDGGSASG